MTAVCYQTKKMWVIFTRIYLKNDLKEHKLENIVKPIKV